MGQKLKAIGSSYVPELVPFFQNPFHIYLFFPTGYVQNSLTGCLCGVQKIGGLNNSSNYGLSPLSMSQKPQVASKDEQIPPLLAAHSLQGARELHCPYTRLKVVPHVVGIQGQGVRAVQ